MSGRVAFDGAGTLVGILKDILFLLDHRGRIDYGELVGVVSSSGETTGEAAGENERAWK